MPKMNMVQAINLALDQEMAKDNSVIVLGEDVGLDGGVFRVTDGLFKKYGETRVIDTPLAESAIVGMSIGMAVAGLKPVAEMQFCGFSYLSIPQMEGHASRLRSRSQGEYGVPMVLRFPYGGGVRALEHHSEASEPFYAHIPGVKVVVPSGPRNARALMVAALRDPDPVVFMEPKRSYRAFREDVPEEEEVLEIGKANIVQEGTDITVISWGAMMRATLEACESVAKKRQTKIEIMDLLTLQPMDSAAIAASVTKTGRCVVVQEGPRALSISSEVVAKINDRALMYLKAPVKRITGYDVPTPYFGRELLYIPGPELIAKGIEETLDF